MSDKLTNKRLDQIEKAAREATPGPWHWMKPGIDYYEVLNDSTCVAIDMIKQADAEHIANMDPDTALSLIARIKELESERELLRATLNEEIARTEEAIQRQTVATSGNSGFAYGLKWTLMAMDEGGKRPWKNPGEEPMTEAGWVAKWAEEHRAEIEEGNAVDPASLADKIVSE